MNLTAGSRIDGPLFVSEDLIVAVVMDTDPDYEIKPWVYTRQQIAAAIEYKAGQAWCHIRHTGHIGYSFVVRSEECDDYDRAFIMDGPYHFNLAILAGGSAEVARKIIAWTQEKE